MAAIDGWMARIVTLSASDPAMALQVAELARLVKGYSDTHERGKRNFDTLMAVEPNLRDPAILAQLRGAALADDTGGALRAALSHLPPPAEAQDGKSGAALLPASAHAA